jgi:hypothetical protein
VAGVSGAGAGLGDPGRGGRIFPAGRQREAISVADADVVIEPAGENLCRLGDALAELALRPGEVPRVRALSWLTMLDVVTAYGRVDCLLERGRLEWQRLRQSAVRIPVADVDVRVTAQADVWDLRHRFKE